MKKILALILAGVMLLGTSAMAMATEADTGATEGIQSDAEFYSKADLSVLEGKKIGGIPTSLAVEIPVMLFVMLFMTLPALKRGKLTRPQGIILLCVYAAFCAFQFYMNAKDGLDCESIILSARAKGHTVSMNKLADGRYKVMCYSGVNSTFAGSEGELFNILTSGASGKLTLEDLFFVTPGASKVKFGNMDIDVVPTGISSIDADANGNANTIFDLSGCRVQKAQKGVYIVNGKKVIL